MRLALRILRPHSLTLTVSLSHCLSHLSHLSHLFLISLSSLSLSLLSVSRLSVSLLSLLSQEDPGKEPHITKASEASWSYSCDSKVSFDRVQILTPDFSGLPTSPLLLLVFLPSSLPPSLLPLRKFDSVLSSLFGMRLALRILRPHSLTLSLSLSHCLSHLSHLSHLFLISLISLSSLSLSLLSVSRLSVSLLSLLSQEDPGKEPHIIYIHIKDSSPLPPKRAPCFFLPRCPPLSHSGALAFAPPWPQVTTVSRPTS